MAENGKFQGKSVAFVSQKGGVLKSTLSRMTAREAALEEWNVKIADLDLQQTTSTKWAARRMDNGLEPKIYCQVYPTAAEALSDTRPDLDMLIIDAPARASKGTEDIAKAVDLVVQPVSPSLDDLEPAVSLFHELAGKGIPREKLVFALVNTETEAEEADTRDYLSRTGYAVLPGSIPHRPAFRQALNAGKALSEAGPLSLRKKARALTRAIAARLMG